MTTIAIRNRILAADTQLTLADDIRTFCRKLFPQPGGGCIALAGDCDDEWMFRQWWAAGEHLETWDSVRMKKAKFDAIWIDQWNDVWWYADGPEKFPVDHPFHAIGSGAKLAMAAMHMGMGAKEAVLFAAELDVNTNFYVDTYNGKTRKTKLAEWPPGRTSPPST